MEERFLDFEAESYDEFEQKLQYSMRPTMTWTVQFKNEIETLIIFRQFQRQRLNEILGDCAQSTIALSFIYSRDLESPLLAVLYKKPKAIVLNMNGNPDSFEQLKEVLSKYQVDFIPPPNIDESLFGGFEVVQQTEVDRIRSISKSFHNADLLPPLEGFIDDVSIKTITLGYAIAICLPLIVHLEYTAPPKEAEEIAERTVEIQFEHDPNETEDFVSFCKRIEVLETALGSSEELVTESGEFTCPRDGINYKNPVLFWSHLAKHLNDEEDSVNNS